MNVLIYLYIHVGHFLSKRQNVYLKKCEQQLAVTSALYHRKKFGIEFELHVHRHTSEGRRIKKYEMLRVSAFFLK